MEHKLGYNKRNVFDRTGEAQSIQTSSTQHTKRNKNKSINIKTECIFFLLFSFIFILYCENCVLSLLYATVILIVFAVLFISLYSFTLCFIFIFILCFFSFLLFYLFLFFRYCMRIVNFYIVETHFYYIFKINILRLL